MIALLLLVIFGGIYGVAYYMNSKVPIPKDAQKKLEHCQGCSIDSCELHPNKKEREGDIL